MAKTRSTKTAKRKKMPDRKGSNKAGAVQRATPQKKAKKAIKRATKKAKAAKRTGRTTATGSSASTSTGSSAGRGTAKGNKGTQASSRSKVRAGTGKSVSKGVAASAAAGKASNQSPRPSGKKEGGKKGGGTKVSGKKRGGKKVSGKKVSGKKVSGNALPSAKPRRTVGDGGKNASPSRNAAGRVEQPRRYAEERPLPKTRLKPKDLEEFRGLLLAKRRELVGDMMHLSSPGRSSSGGSSTAPLHMADAGSDNWEQEFTLGLLANERTLIREIDEALERIDDGTYGMCLGTRKPIKKSRLRAKPWAKYCIEYARLRELGRMPS